MVKSMKKCMLNNHQGLKKSEQKKLAQPTMASSKGKLKDVYSESDELITGSAQKISYYKLFTPENLAFYQQNDLLLEFVYQNWMPLFVYSTTIYPDLVNEFYKNMTDMVPHQSFTTTVREIKIKLDAAKVCKILGIPNEGLLIDSVFAPYRKEFSLSKQEEAVFGHPVEKTSTYVFSSLSHKIRVGAYILKYTLNQKNHRGEIGTKMDLFLLAFLIKVVRPNMGSYLVSKMLDCNRPKQGFALGAYITDFLIDALVPLKGETIFRADIFDESDIQHLFPEFRPLIPEKSISRIYAEIKGLVASESEEEKAATTVTAEEEEEEEEEEEDEEGRKEAEAGEEVQSGTARSAKAVVEEGEKDPSPLIRKRKFVISDDDMPHKSADRRPKHKVVQGPTPASTPATVPATSGTAPLQGEPVPPREPTLP